MSSVNKQAQTSGNTAGYTANQNNQNNKNRQHQVSVAFLWTAILIISSVLALRQLPYADAEKSLNAYQQFLHPWENYPLLRLPFIKGNFTDVWVLPNDTQQVWAITDNGIILHSENGGLSWSRQTISIEALPSALTEPKTFLFRWQLWSSAVAMDASQAEVPNYNSSENKAFPLKKSDQRQREDEPNAIYQQNSINRDNKEDKRILEKRQAEKQFLEKQLAQKQINDPKQQYQQQQEQQQQQQQQQQKLEQQQDIKNQELQNQDPQKEAVMNAPGRLQRIFFADHNTGWISSDNGIYLVTTNGGKQWQAQLLLPPIALQYPQLGFTSPDYSRWRIGKFQQLEMSEDGGKTWLLRSRNVATDQQWLRAQKGWRQTQNQLQIKKGDQWITPVYHRYPPPWLWLVSLILAVFFIEILRRLGVVQILPPTVADLLASDRPLKPGDPDPLRFGAIARSLSRFMRNPNTEPPLTIAITGEWGTGKSSLMNLLYHDLRSFGFTPVWFNAWHHQKGEQLLAALYANIRQQAIPGWLRFSGGVPVGFLFRLRLLHRRGRQNWLMFLVLCVALTAALTYLFTHPLQWHSLEFQTFLGAFATLAVDQDIQSQLLVALLGIVPSAAALLRTVRAFGVDPMKLIAWHGSNDGNKMDPSARQKFAKEFSDVTSSLELGRMVIFIDDLDRCSQENVLDIMEAMNFLSVSGQCYIVIGMAEKWVKTCIGLGFKAMAEETFVDDGRSDLLQRQAFADQYLEKMINISVPVPTLQAEDSERLLIAQPLLESLSLQKKMWRRFLEVYQRYQVVGVLLLAIACGAFLGVNDQAFAQFSAWITPVTKATNNTAAPQFADTEVVPDRLPNENQSALDTAALDQRLKLSDPWGENYIWWLGLIILMAWSSLLARQPQRIVPDSVDFRAALAIWQPWITIHRQTPRAIKRFLNRVRYHAMRVRTDLEELRVADDQLMSEADLVALSAIYAMAPEWLENNDHFQQLANNRLHDLLSQKFPSDQQTNERLKTIKELMQVTLNKHKEKFGDAIFTQLHLRQRFLLGLARKD